jgi:hypothetical protein
MRKFYSVLNMLVFCFVLYYITCKPSNENLKHAAIIMGGVAILAAGYMAYFEYTDDSEEVRTNQIGKMKESYNSKISELLNRTEDYEQKDKYLHGMNIENKDLVEELSFTKKLILKLKGELNGKKAETGKEINNQFVIPSERFGIDTKQQNQQQKDIPNTDTNNTQFENENYHFTQFPNQAPISQSTGGPPQAQNTMGNETVNMDDRLNEYKSYTPNQPQQQPGIPDFLKPVETNPGKNTGGY